MGYELKSVLSKCENPDYGVAFVKEGTNDAVKVLVDVNEGDKTPNPRIQINGKWIELNKEKDKVFIDAYKSASDPNLRNADVIKNACNELDSSGEKKYSSILPELGSIGVAFGAGFTDKFLRQLRNAGSGNSDLRTGLQVGRWALNGAATFAFPHFYPDLSPTAKLISIGLYAGSIGAMAALDREGALAFYGINTGTNIVSALISDKAGRGWGAGFQLIAGLGFTIAGAVLYTSATPVRPQDVGVTPSPNDMFFSGPNAFQDKQQLLNGVDFLEIGTNNLAAGGLRLALHVFGKKSEAKISFNTLRDINGRPNGAMGSLRMDW